MRERTRILREADRLRRADEPAVVATIVEIDGSSYRLEGARMLVRPNGEYVGTISGGCLEGEVVERTKRVLETGRSDLVPLEQREGEDPFGFGSGCGGTIHVLLEPFRAAPEAPGALNFVRQCVEKRTAGALATVYRTEGDLSGEQGRHLLVTSEAPSGRGNIESDVLRGAVVEDAMEVLHEEQALRSSYAFGQGRAVVLIEYVKPSLRLLIVGEEHDVAPLVAQSNLLGWEPVVVGASPAPDLKEQFPDAAGHVSLPHPEAVAEALLNVGERDAAVVMSHNYIRDRAVLRFFLRSDAGYVGALGARSRLERLAEDFTEGERPEDRAAREAIADGRLHAPVGLDIGAETPEEIALSIAAEIQAVCAGARGGFLSEGTGRIHPSSMRVKSAAATAGSSDDATP
jgi:xanthine/CO dehydrogenase XdhC/CoxF family maturation factor